MYSLKAIWHSGSISLKKLSMIWINKIDTQKKEKEEEEEEEEEEKNNPIITLIYL